MPQLARNVLSLRVASCVHHRKLNVSHSCEDNRRVMHELEDGEYDAFVVWAEQRGDELALECTIVSGEHRGDVVNIVTSEALNADALELVGLPCTVHVRGEIIRFTRA